MNVPHERWNTLLPEARETVTMGIRNPGKVSEEEPVGIMASPSKRVERNDGVSRVRLSRGVRDGGRSVISRGDMVSRLWNAEKCRCKRRRLDWIDTEEVTTSMRGVIHRDSTISGCGA